MFDLPVNSGPEVLNIPFSRLRSIETFALDFTHVICLASQIEDGEIYASINQKDGMVCFHDNPEKYNNPAMLHKIDQEVRKKLFSFCMIHYDKHNY